ncbi:TniB family NTP-binding protein [Thalassospira povalilytica]|uniref:TniB family NTP-binding protein n=1 Tax=Thalassospira povalilytica TaxID=732237 RepID=UPI001D184E08|nr:TniB family NTP-binding protein [Thalassospira povalilytica]MCC4242074.1 TniB family NTP-binding protein [Thalassospira povalilytica]
MHKEMILTDAQADGLAAFQNQRIHHNQFQQATARITNFHRSGARAYAPGIMTLVGETGAGKSSIIENFCTVANNGHDCSRVLSIIIPQSCTIKNLASRILHALGDPCASMGTRESMERRIARFADHTSVSMLIFDEFQHLTNKGSQARRYDTADWLKTQLEILRRPVLFVGLPEVNDIFMVNPQLETRRRGRIELLPFDPSTKDGAKELLMLFHFLNNELPLPDPSKSVLKSSEVMLRLARSCKGLIGYITKVIYRAVEIALLARCQALTEQHLMAALSELKEASAELDTKAIRPSQFGQSKATGKMKMRLEKGVSDVPF